MNIKKRIAVLIFSVAAVATIIACGSGSTADIRNLCALAGIDLDGNELVVSDDRGGIYSSTNGGGTFDQQSTDTDSGITSLSLGANYAFATGTNGYLSSRLSIQLEWETLKTDFSNNVYDSERFGDETLFVGADGLFGTYDGQMLNYTMIPEASGINLYKLSCPTRMTCYTAGTAGTIGKTTDGGLNWTWQNSGTNFNLHSVYALDEDTAYAVGDEGTYTQTFNGGEEWTVRADYGFKGRLNDVYYWDKNDGIVAGENVYTTTDGGEHWFTDLVRDLSRLIKYIWIDAFGSIDQGWLVGGDDTLIMVNRLSNGYQFSEQGFYVTGDDNSSGSGGEDNNTGGGSGISGGDGDSDTTGGDGDSEFTGEDPNQGTSGPPFTIGGDQISFNHSVGSTECPQDIGTFTVTNTSNTKRTFSLSVEGPLAASPGSFMLEPGAVQTISVVFTCTQASSFTGKVNIESAGSTGSVTIAGNVG